MLLGGVPRFEAESLWALRLARRCLAGLPAASATLRRGVRLRVAHLEGTSPIVLVQADPEAYLPPRAASRLLELVASGAADVAVPVSNEPWCEAARSEAPFPYQTPSLLEEAARAVEARGGEPRADRPIRSPVFAARREALAGLPRDLPLDAAVERAAVLGRRVRVDPGAYLHRYGAMDGQAREDLAVRIPAGSRSVLDVGCSRGATAAALRRAGVTEIFGIEPDAGDAAVAARRYDRVLAVPLESVTEDFDRRFDAILFGDVLEHLEDPSAALLRVRSWLSPRGAVVASVPNIGHWSVIADLLQGRFDYVPYSILSGTHIRFFTRHTLIDLFEACGFEAPRIDTVRFPPSPFGEAALATFRSIPGASEDLDAVEFIAAAGRR